MTSCVVSAVESIPLFQLLEIHLLQSSNTIKKSKNQEQDLHFNYYYIYIFFTYDQVPLEQSDLTSELTECETHAMWAPCVKMLFFM